MVDKVLEKKPDVVTIMFGSNDLGLEGHRGVGEFKERLRSLVTPLKQAGVRVILLTTPYVDGTGPLASEWQDRCLPFMGDAVIALGREEGLPVFDMFTAMRQLTEVGRKTDAGFTLFAVDKLHPSAEGQKLMGRALADFPEGRPSPSRPPFVLNVERPEATAGRVAKPLDVAAADAAAWPATSTPMILDKPEQICGAHAAEAACGKGDAFDPATVKAFCRRTPQGYVITASVPWSTLGFAPRADANIGYDFTVINRMAAEPARDRDYYGLWRANGNDYLDAGCLGILTLDGRSTP